MAKAIKTNVLRHLDALKIPYETREYTVEDEQFDGLLTAHKLGMDPAMVFKTLVLTGDKLPHLVCCLPVASLFSPKLMRTTTPTATRNNPPNKRQRLFTFSVKSRCLLCRRLFPSCLRQLRQGAMNAGQ